ncbi:MAG: 16S rRNA (guanine(966)-N(2))-methyltransferase RsmD [Spirochaetales bacterium]|nr:16S rRNA (guanine(966)-N(2))-methyltransferase RsmD [Spirochaetales bacterium]
MRITGGKYVRRQIKCPPGIIRPAMDRMRESLFSILGDLSGYSFLDLFAGSGIMSLEAASRGAYPILAIEKDIKKKRVILENFLICEKPIEIRFTSAEKYILKSKKTFDVIYLDPPFDFKNKQKLLSSLGKSPLIHDESRVIIHVPREDKLNSEVGPLTNTDLRKYGGSWLYFYHVRSCEEGSL